MALRGLGSVIVLTGFYWVSNLVVALWIGGFLTANSLFTLPLDMLPEGASSAAVEVAAGTAIGMIDRLRPFFVAAAIVLMASVVLSVILERQARHSAGWWVIWVIRSAASAAMVATAFYSFGDIDGRVSRVEQDIASLRSPTISFAGNDTSVAGQSARAAGAGASLPGSRAFGEATAATVQASLEALHVAYTKWMWIEFGLGAFILLAGAIKEAAWRHTWVDERSHRGQPGTPETMTEQLSDDGG